MTDGFWIWKEWQAELLCFLHLVWVCFGSSRILDLRCNLGYLTSFVGDLLSDLTSPTAYRLQNASCSITCWSITADRLGIQEKQYQFQIWTLWSPIFQGCRCWLKLFGCDHLDRIWTMQELFHRCRMKIHDEKGGYVVLWYHMRQTNHRETK